MIETIDLILDLLSLPFSFFKRRALLAKYGDLFKEAGCTVQMAGFPWSAIKLTYHGKAILFDSLGGWQKGHYSFSVKLNRSRFILRNKKLFPDSTIGSFFTNGANLILHVKKEYNLDSIENLKRLLNILSDKANQLNEEIETRDKK